MVSNVNAEKVIQQAFINQVRTIVGAGFPVQWPNAKFDKPGVDAPYIKGSFIYADTTNPVVGTEMYRITGILQLDLKYPANTGEGDLLEMFGLIKNSLAYGFTFSSNGVTTQVLKTPTLGPVIDDEVRYVRPVRVPFFANVF